jgi:hypothetical protein
MGPCGNVCYFISHDVKLLCLTYIYSIDSSIVEMAVVINVTLGFIENMELLGPHLIQILPRNSYFHLYASLAVYVCDVEIPK